MNWTHRAVDARGLWTHGAVDARGCGRTACEESGSPLRSPVPARLARQRVKPHRMEASGGEEEEEEEEEEEVEEAVSENEADSMQEQEQKCAVPNKLSSCPVCCLNGREPKLLPCLHSFCKKCLPAPSRNLALATPLSSGVDGVKLLNVIRCPVCRQECMEEDVMENVFVQDAVEAPSSTVERPVQICMTCDDNAEAAGFCVNCAEYLCAACVEAHQRVKFTKGHAIAEKSEVSKEIHGRSTQRPMFCDLHKQEPLKLFCETCDLLTCRDCQLVRHKDHSYHFLEDAYKHHKQHVESVTHQLQDKRKLVEDVSNTINSRLLQAEQNYSSVQAEIKNSISSLIAEMNKKGQTLLSELESVTKDHKSVLLKQQEDVGYLSRHLEHVISFTEWATARNRATAFLHCKRSILFQMGNLLQAKCSPSFVPQTVVRFQGRSSYWASGIDLGSLLVERTPGNHPPGFQGIPYHAGNLRQGPPGPPHGFTAGAPRNTLAQLQMQVEKLNPTAPWHAQPQWAWCQSVRLPPSGPEGLPGRAPSHSAAAQSRCKFTASRAGAAGGLPNPGFAPQHPGLLGSSSSYQPKPGDVFSYISPLPIGVGSPQSRHMVESPYLNKGIDPVHTPKRIHPQTLVSCAPHSDVQGQQNPAGLAAVSQEENSGSLSWKPAKTCQTSGDDGPSATKRQKPSPGPIIVIKDEPDDDISYVNKRTSLPDSTGDRPDLTTPASSQDEEDPSSPRRPDGSFQSPARLHGARSDRSSCAVCRTGGELLSCAKCSKQFHLPCHIPALQNFPSGRWLCLFCLDFSETGSGSTCEAGRVKTESDSEGGFPPEDKRKCERLLLQLFCSDLGPDYREPPTAWSNNRKNGNGPTKLHTVRKRLEATRNLCYQNLAEFVSDVRLACRSRSAKPDPGGAAESKKLNERFEEHLRNVFPDRAFPEMKLSSSPDSAS